jgi:phosphoribosylformylglycinamidine synthase
MTDRELGALPIDLPMNVLFGKAPKMHRDAHSQSAPREPVNTTAIPLEDAAKRILRCPTVGDKSFLITIGDRSVTGLVARDQMVGPWQVAVADVAVTMSTYGSRTGEAMAIGERTPLALVNPAASARMAIGEACTNLAAACVSGIETLRLSANWMAPAGHPGEDVGLFEMARTIGEELCPALGICIPVGKDSMSMRATWEDGEETRTVTAPLSLIVSAFAPVVDVRKTVTPQLRTDLGDTDLLFVDLGRTKNRLGGSIFAQVTNQVGDEGPDVDDAGTLKAFFNTIQTLLSRDAILAYHDRSDGGLFVALTEMAFAGKCGVTVSIDGLGEDPAAVLFNEELGAVLQVRAADARSRPEGSCLGSAAVQAAFRDAGLLDCIHVIGTTNDSDRIVVVQKFREVLSIGRTEARLEWSQASLAIQGLRDNPACAHSERARLSDAADPGLSPYVSFSVGATPALPGRPRVAILREQGVNGQTEMAAAFDRAGFEAVDVHMSDVLRGRTTLAGFRGLAVCGGFSYGDVLGAGEGWAKSILFNDRARAEFETFFHRPDTFSLGVCNGCQMMSTLRDLIPGASGWPRFIRNESEQFEARVCTLEITDSPSVLLTGMSGSRLPIAVAHGEGRVELAQDGQSPLVAARYVDNRGHATTEYPANPNGSGGGVTAVTSSDGRATIMMPHPERVFLTSQFSWHPDDWPEESPWMTLFRNARAWVG